MISITSTGRKYPKPNKSTLSLLFSWYIFFFFSMFFFKAGKSKNLVTDYVYRSNHGDRADRGRAGSIDSGRSFCSDTTHFYCVCTYAVRTGEQLRSDKKKKAICCRSSMVTFYEWDENKPTINRTVHGEQRHWPWGLAGGRYMGRCYIQRATWATRSAFRGIGGLFFSWKSFHLGVREPRPQLSKIGTA